MNDSTPITTEEAKPIEVETSPNIAKGVASVMADVKRLEKADNNPFAKYKYTSVDDFKDALRPLMAAQGLSVCVSQVGMDRFEWSKDEKTSTTHCQFDFEIWLEHDTGEKSEREGTSVCLPYTGAQTTGQARSYAQKEWLKSRFMQSTGDTAEDADAHDVNIQLTKAQARDLDQAMRRELVELGKTGTRDGLSEWFARNTILIEALPNDWKVMLRQEYETTLFDIKKRTATETAKDALPEDVEAWLADLDAQLSGAQDSTVLGEVWMEHSHVVDILPDAERKRAFDALEKNEDRFGLI